MINEEDGRTRKVLQEKRSRKLGGKERKVELGGLKERRRIEKKERISDIMKKK